MKTNNPLWVTGFFTFIYLGIASFSPIQSGFLSTFVRVLLLSIATLCSVLLWVIYFVWGRRGSMSVTRLLIIAMLLPVVVCGIPAAILSYRSNQLQDLDARIKKEATVITMEDEELVTDHGNPIGVRLRYQVRYPKGSDALISHIPPANLSSRPAPYSGGFWILSTEIHALNATDYLLISDVVPEFLPSTLRFVENPKYPGSGGKDPCFYWQGGPSQRTDVLNAQPRTFRIYMSEPAYDGPTRRSYDLHRFYDGAVKQGAKECP
jgi:hypothetical protein